MKRYILTLIYCLTVLILTAQLSIPLSNELKLKSGHYIPEANIKDYIKKASQAPKALISNRYYRLIQFNELPTSSEIKTLEQEGITLLTYVPNKAYIASISAAYNPQKFISTNIRYITGLDKNYVVSEELLTDNIPSWADRADKKIEVSINYPKDLKQETILAACQQNGLTPTAFNEHNHQLLALVNSKRLREIMTLPFILHLDFGPEPSKPDNIASKTLARANILDSPLASGRHYNGSGISVLTRDDGDVGPHIDFQGRITQNITDSSPADTHADLVSGMMCGAANLDPCNQGMATNADLYVINYDASFLDNTMDLHLDDNVLVTNSSYSNGCNRGYTNTTITVEDQCYENPFLMHVFSAGNDGASNCNYGAGPNWGNITGGHKQAKNVITVGSTDSRGEIANSSSRGPAYDGRIKPDITAHGNGVRSTGPDHTYRSTSGTSFSAPLVSGVMAMLHQAYQDNNNGQVGEAALLKTLMLNTANDLGNPGPDYIFGWGSINAYKAALTIEEKRYLKNEITQGEIVSHDILVPNNVQEIKVMVYWTDPSAEPQASTALINDLTTSISSPSGNTYSPWVLDPTPDPSLLDTPATTGIETLNNMEQISILNPEAGIHTLNVLGQIIPFGTHDYFVTWEYIMPNLTITFPAGGEALVSGDTEIIHWDGPPNGERINIELSLDGGNTWEQQGQNLGSQEKLASLSIPEATTNAALIRLTRGNETTLSQPFTITAEPEDFEVIQLCEEVVYGWTAVPGAISYDVYKLGERFMEVQMTTEETSVAFPFRSCGDEDWYAVAANFPNDIKGQRTIAVRTGIDLIDCDLTQELELANMITPLGANYIVCEGPVVERPQFLIRNQGIMPISNFEITYMANGQDAVTETITETIEADSAFVYTFNQPYTLTDNGLFDITVWLSSASEVYTCNDTLSDSGQIYFDKGVPIPFSEDFSGVREFDDYWRVESLGDLITWDIDRGVQRNSGTGNFARIPFDIYDDRGAQDNLYVIPLDMSEVAGTIALSFDMAYLDGSRDDGLSIYVSADCGQSFTDTIYAKIGEALGSSFSAFERPQDVTHWTTEEIDLSAYAGMDKVILKFESYNDNGNNLYIDNINVQAVQQNAPKADLYVEGQNFCPNEVITILDESSGHFLSHEWDFGFGGLPGRANYKGPHAIKYILPGTKTIALEVSNELGTDMTTVDLQVIDRPLGGWTHEELGDATVQFTTNFQYGDRYIWDFGDGRMSFQQNPTHQYDMMGTYEVTLSASNKCGLKTLSGNVTVETSSTKEEESHRIANVYPNPTNGDFTVNIELDKAMPIELSLWNTQGRAIWVEQEEALGRAFSKVYSQADIPVGVYLLQIRAGEKMESIKLVIVD